MPLGCPLSSWIACNCLNMWFSYGSPCSPCSSIYGLFSHVLVIQNCSMASMKRFHCISTAFNCFEVSVWHVCSGNVLFINTDRPLNFGCIHISPTLMWCLIAGIKCSRRSFGKLGNNIGGPFPPPPLQNWASGFFSPIYKGTLLFACITISSHSVSYQETNGQGRGWEGWGWWGWWDWHWRWRIDTHWFNSF